MTDNALTEALPEEDRSSLNSHLCELRNRLILSLGLLAIVFVCAYSIAPNIYGFLVQPLADLFEGETNRRLIYTKLTEAFFTYIKVAFFTACFVTFPFIACQIYLFLAPGLYKHEKKALLPFLIACPVLFLAGASMVYYGIIPLAWEFFLGFEQLSSPNTLPIQLEAKVGEYLSLVMQLIFAFGVAFQLPVILNLLARVGIISSEGLANKRKYAIIGIVSIAAIITPPDIISQIGLAVPMWLLYECSIFSCRWVEKKKQRKETNKENANA